MHALVVAITLLAASPTTKGAGIGGAPSEVAIARGRSAEAGAAPIDWEYHYDRNALRRTVPVSGGFLTLTEAGNLLLFDAELRTVRKEYVGPVPITDLAGDDKIVVAGFADGRLVTVDPVTLAFAAMTSVQGSVVWIGRRPAGWVVVHDGAGNQTGPRRHRPEIKVTDLATKKTYDLPKLRPSAFLVDRRDRLWLGEDHGEWGGSASWLDLATGKRHDVTMPGHLDNNVYGFAELADGSVLAFGGVMHMILLGSFVTRVDSTPPTVLWRWSNGDSPRALAESELPRQPRLPITHLVPTRDGTVLVFSFSDVFRVNAKFREWQRLARLELNYQPGRPDAVGSYPAMRQVLPLNQDSGKLLLVTGSDGHVLLAEGTSTARALPGQLGLRFPASAGDSPAGFLVLSDDDEEATIFDGMRWASVKAPAIRLSVADRFANELDKTHRERISWRQVRWARSPKGDLYAFSEGPWSPGTRAVDRWQNGGFVPVATSQSSLSVETYFFSPDDDVWADDGGYNRFQRLHDGHWQSTGWPKPSQRSAGRGPYLRNLRLLSSGKPPWLYLQPWTHSLIRFDPGDEQRTPSCGETLLERKGARLGVLDAVLDPDGTVLLASETGLYRYDPSTAALTPSTFVPEGEPVHSLARDGHGRLWLAGRKLWVVPTGQRNAVTVSSLPLSGEPRLLGPWAKHPDGVAIGVYGRGILFVETGAATAPGR